MTIEYKINEPVTVEDFYSVLIASTLSERRPINDTECLKGMLANTNLMVSAWDQGELIGIARSMTDFHYACYLSDLAVSQDYQNSGVGKRLQQLTQSQLGPECKLVLLASPAAKDYYGHIGFEHNPRCWVLEPGESIV